MCKSGCGKKVQKAPKGRDGNDGVGDAGPAGENGTNGTNGTTPAQDYDYNVWINPAGDDGTGELKNFFKPFATLNGAKTAVLAFKVSEEDATPWSVWVMNGSYNEALSFVSTSDGDQWHFEDAFVLAPITITDSKVKILGTGKFKNRILVTGINTVTYLQGKYVYNDAASSTAGQPTGSNAADAISHVSGGICNFDFKYIVSDFGRSVVTYVGSAAITDMHTEGDSDYVGSSSLGAQVSSILLAADNGSATQIVRTKHLHTFGINSQSTCIHQYSQALKCNQIIECPDMYNNVGNVITCSSKSNQNIKGIAKVGADVPIIRSGAGDFRLRDGSLCIYELILNGVNVDTVPLVELHGEFASTTKKMKMAFKNSVFYHGNALADGAINIGGGSANEVMILTPCSSNVDISAANVTKVVDAGFTVDADVVIDTQSYPILIDLT